MSALAIGLAVLAGLAGPVQVAVMGRFGSRIGVLEAPKWLWAGGAMGLLVVLTITFAQPRIGATATIGILIAGQLVMGAVIDRLGLFGVDQIGISWPRALGIGLLGVGAALSLVR